MNEENLNKPPPLSSKQSYLYRQPPPPPSSSTSSGSSSSTSSSTQFDQETQQIPQAPIRTHIKTNPSSYRSNQNKTNISPITTNIQHENATDAATRLVYKSVMMGSIPCLNQTFEQQHQQYQQQVQFENTNLQNHLRNLSISSTGSGDMNNTNGNNYYLNAQNNKKLVGEVASNLILTPILNQYNNNNNNDNVDNIDIRNRADLSPNKFNNNNNNNINKKNKNIINNLPNFVNGEVLIDEENDGGCTEIIFVLPDNRGVSGKLYITNFRLYFKSDEAYSFNNVKNSSNYMIIDLPLGLINRIEKIGHQSSKQYNFYGLVIYCKNGRRLRFAINLMAKQDKSRKQIYDLIHKFAFPISNQLNYFAYAFREEFPDQSGWFIYDCKQEYERIGVTTKTNDWRFTNVNQEFKFCDTYPKMLVVPQNVTDEELKQIGEFRSKHRIPVLSWLKFDTRKNHVALLRSSQPLCGLTQKRNEKDENYLFKISKLNHTNMLDKFFIMDARPVMNAYANRTTGGGHESEDNYKDCEIAFLNIHNIHVMRESLRKIFDMALPNPSQSNINQTNQQQTGVSSTNTLSSSNSASSSTNNSNNINQAMNNGQNQTSKTDQLNSNDDKNFLLNLENSKWLEHIRSVLNGSLKIVKYINTYNSSVLVHCSDGWDRTAQLTSLSMLMMDKYYRTLKGFEVLIEKEWLSFGHRFGIRMGHGSCDHSNQDRSPIFLQFIDCVWQLMQQNSKVFEFNEKFLLTIVNNMYTCQFGTFLYNNEYERDKHDVRIKTVSLWSYINSYKNEFKNSAYNEYDGVVECSTSISSLQLWISYYFQYKEVVDDSNLSDWSLIETQNMIMNNRNQFTKTPPMPTNKIFGQAFFQQMVNQMKATVRSYNTASIVGAQTQDPELVRYKAVMSTD